MATSNDTKRADEYEGEQVTTATGDQLLLEELLGEGAEGCVYRAQSNAAAVKIFWRSDRSPRLARKLRAMIQNPPIDPTETSQGKKSIIWPTNVVESIADDEFLGYSMPYLDLDQYQNALTYAYDDLGWSNSPLAERLKAAVNLASVVAVVHKQGHGIGDLNHLNILVNDGVVAFIDCDSYHISAHGTDYKGSKIHPRYAPAGGRGSSLQEVKEADRFGLAVHLFQLLMEGYHPFVARGANATGGEIKDQIRNNRFVYSNPGSGDLAPPPNAPDYEALPVELRRLFEQCFRGGKTDPSQRPTAETWVKTIQSMFSEGSTGGSTKRQQRSQRGRSPGQGQSQRGSVRKQRRQRRATAGRSTGAPQKAHSSAATTQQHRRQRSASQSTGGRSAGATQSQQSADDTDELGNLLATLMGIGKYAVAFLLAFAGLSLLFPGDLAFFLSGGLTLGVALWG